MTPRQLVLPLPRRTASGRADYFVSDSNRPALDAVESWPDWPGGMLAVTGPAGSGKTHLAHVHAARAAATGRPASDLAGGGRDLIVPDIDAFVGNPAAEEALFHAFNRIAAENGSILFTARNPLAGWPVALPDLRTRLNTVHTVELPAPDDALLQAVLLKLFADRQIDPERAAEVAGWLVSRMERSLAGAEAVVEALDALSLAEKRRIDVRLAAQVLRQDPDA